MMFRRTTEIITSSFKMALQELWKNKLRTFLSLFGITIGIFCIIGVLATVNSLKRNVENDINSLGTNSIYIDKWEYGPGGEWWKMAKRPPIRYAEMKLLEPRVKSAEYMAFKIDTRDKIEFEDNVVTGVTYFGI